MRPDGGERDEEGSSGLSVRVVATIATANYRRIDRYFSYVEKYIQEQAVLYTCIYIKICRQENDRAHRLTRLTFSLLIKFVNQLYFIDSVLSHLSLITSITGKEEDLVGKECVNSS